MIATLKMTGAEFDALPYDEGRRWELLSGDLIEVPSPTPKHQKVVSNFTFSLVAHFRKYGYGDVYPDVEFALSESVRLRPDVAILVRDTWQKVDEERSPIPFAPDIAIEIISPSERTAESVRKVQAYLRHGVKEVWQVFPQDRTIFIYPSTFPLIILGAEDTLSSSLLPEWALRVSEALDS